MLDYSNVHIGHIILLILAIYVACKIKPSSEKNLTLVYLDKEGHITNIDPPIEIKVGKDDIKLETGYRLDKYFFKKDMIFLLIRPITHKYKRMMNKYRSNTTLVVDPSCHKTLRIKECY